MSHLASVFLLEGASASWSKLRGDHKLSKLFSKYWGKDIEHDAKQWHKSHSSRAARSGTISVTEVPRSVVITGQPGIGKTYWVTYAVRRRLGEQKPFLWYRGGVCFLFVEDGVFQQDVNSVSADDFAPFLWAFIDADACSTGVPEELLYDTNLYIMFTTSPERDRWKPLTSCTDCAAIIMNPWFLEEIRLAAEILGLTNEQQNSAEANFKDLGPIPRMCINLAKDPDQRLGYENLCKNMISCLTSRLLRHFVLAGGDMDLVAESDAIFIVRRLEVDDLRRAYIEPISANVEMQLMSTINELQRLEKIDLYRAFVSIDATKGVAGLVYESLGHTCIQEGINLTIRPMIKQQRQKLFHRKCQGEERASNWEDQDESVYFPPNTPIIYEEGKLRSVEPMHLHVPKARNQVTFDSFFKRGAFLYIFRITVAKDHDIKSGIEDSLSKLQTMLPPKANWRFVLITPPGCEVDVKATSEVEKFLEGVTLYSAHLEIKRRMNV